MKKTNKSILIAIVSLILLTGLATSCATVTSEDIAADIESGITESGVEDVTIKVTEEGVQLIDEGLIFPPDSAELIDATAAELDKLAMVIAKYNNKQILILGHTADIGDKASQIELSTARATAVAEYLLSKEALKEGHYTVEGKGGEMPFSDDTSKEGLAKNRRVEIIILN